MRVERNNAKCSHELKLPGLLIAALFISCLIFLPAAAETSNSEVFTVNHDSYVRSAKYSGDNYGTSITLDVKDAAAENCRRVYLKFDLTSLGSFVTVTSAKLKVYGKGAATSVGAYGVEDDTWEESLITWDTAPIISDVEIGNVNLTNSTTFKPYEIDVTDYVTNQVAGDKVISIGLGCITWDKSVSFYSKENTNNLPPELLIEYTSVDPGAPQVTQTLPQNGKKLYINSPAFIDFDVDMDTVSVTDQSNITIQPSVNYLLNYNADQKRVIITFPDGLVNEAAYTITLKGGTIKSADQQALESDKVILFSATAESFETVGVNLVPSSDSARASVQITNNRSDDNLNGILIIALYQNNALIDVRCQEGTIQVGAEGNIQTPVLAVPQGVNDYYFKAFLWDSLKDQRPLMPSVRTPQE